MAIDSKIGDELKLVSPPPTQPLNISDVIKQYQQKVKTPTSFNPDKNHQKSLEKVVEKVVDTLAKQPIADFQRTKTITNIHQHLKQPEKIRLSPKETKILNQIKSSVDASLNTSTTPEDFSFSLHNQLNSSDIPLPEKDDFQLQLNQEFKSVPIAAENNTPNPNHVASQSETLLVEITTPLTVTNQTLETKTYTTSFSPSTFDSDEPTSSFNASIPSPSMPNLVSFGPDGLSLSPKANTILKAFSPGGGGIKSLLGNMGKFLGFGGGATAAGTTAAASGTTAAAAAVASSEVWVPVLIIGLIILFIVLILVFPGTKTILSSKLSPVSGLGGGTNPELESNPFISLTKDGSPSQLPTPSGSITYTYSITAKQGPLTNIVVTEDVVTIFSQSGSTTQSLTAPTPPSQVDSTWTSDSYSFPLDASMKDSIVTNTITITATAPDGSTQIVQASFSTIIGKPPTGCYILNPGPISQITAVNWDLYPGEKQKEMTAISVVLAKLGPTNVCGGPINLYLASSGVSIEYGGWRFDSGQIAFDFRNGSLGSSGNAVYVLAHETGHELDDRLSSIFSDFINSGLVSWNGSCVGNIYPFGINNEGMCYGENFAEGIACFVSPSTPNCQARFTSNWQNFFNNHFP